jgi:hypothetical protein
MSNRRRSRVARVLFWILLIIVALIVLSILFGGFQKGTKAAPRPLFSHTSLAVSRTGPLTRL